MYLKNKLIFSVSVLWVLLLVFSSCGEKKEKKDVNAPIVISDSLIQNMTVGIAHTTQVRSELRLTGKIVADQNKQIDIYPLVGGVVKTINAELGDYVQKDQVLAVIKSGEAADFEKQFVESKSNYDVAKKSVLVAEDMYASKLTSERDYLSAKQDLTKAEADYNKSKELQKIYNVNSESDYTIKAPIAGFIIQKNVNKDQQIRSDNSANLFTVSQLNDVWVLANVYETDIDKIKERDTVGVTTIAYPDKVYKANIDKIYNALDPETRVMKVRIKLNNPDYLLKPEMYANVVVSYAEPEKMITIASSAIVFDNSNYYVVLYNGNKSFKVKKIDLYKTIGAKAYVRSGLDENAHVVTANQLLIYNALTNN